MNSETSAIKVNFPDPYYKITHQTATVTHVLPEPITAVRNEVIDSLNTEGDITSAESLQQLFTACQQQASRNFNSPEKPYLSNGNREEYIQIETKQYYHSAVRQVIESYMEIPPSSLSTEMMNPRRMTIDDVDSYVLVGSAKKSPWSSGEIEQTDSGRRAFVYPVNPNTATRGLFEIPLLRTSNQVLDEANAQGIHGQLEMRYNNETGLFDFISPEAKKYAQQAASPGETIIGISETGSLIVA